MRRLYADDFAWRVPQGGIHNFDRLAGTDQIRLALDHGMPATELVASWTHDLQTFARTRQSYLAYA